MVMARLRTFKRGEPLFRDNGMQMSTSGSEPFQPLHPLLAIAVTLLGAAALLLVVPFAAPTLLHSWGMRGFLAASSILLALPAALAVAALHGRTWREALALDAVPRRTVLLSVLLGAALWGASVGLMEMQALVLPPTPEYILAFRRLHEALAPSGPLDALWSIAAIALVPALTEELVTRGVLLPSLVRPLGAAGAVLASAAAFAAIHVDIYRFLFTFTIGLVLGGLRLRTGSLWPSIVAHATLNAVTFAIAPLIDDPAQTTYTPQPALGVACLLAGAAVAYPLLRALGPRVDSPPHAP